MGVFEKFITGRHHIAKEDLMYSRLVFFHFLAVAGFLLLLIFIVVDFLRGLYITSIFELVLALLLIVSLVLIRYKKSIRAAFIMGSLIVSALCLFNFVGGGFEGAGILWVFIFPPMIFLLRGLKFGMIWSAAFFFLMILFSVLDIFGIVSLPYNSYMTWMSILILLAVTSIIVIFTRIQNRRTEIICEQDEEASENAKKIKLANKNLKEEVKKREKAMADLKKQKETAEKMNELMVGREKKIIELKEEIKELKNK